METMKLLRQLRRDSRISTQQFNTYKGQILSGNEIGCIKGLNRKGLITNAESERLIITYKLGYTE